MGRVCVVSDVKMADHSPGVMLLQDFKHYEAFTNPLNVSPQSYLQQPQYPLPPAFPHITLLPPSTQNHEKFTIPRIVLLPLPSSRIFPLRLQPTTVLYF